MSAAQSQRIKDVERRTEKSSTPTRPEASGLRPAGDRVKTDARDAVHLTRLLRLGEITTATVPEAEVEAVRDLVRAREDARADLMRVRDRLSKLLLRQGRVYSGGPAWNGVHETWLRRQRFDDSHTSAAFHHHFDAMLTATAARDRLDEQIVTIAASPRWANSRSSLISSRVDS
ncbi:IS110 family transposase [Mycobacterium paragordonae]|uniref:IS110 family transposase n=1 Tax=Mycobacterium TaxID=1763 RepID=UPI00398830C8